MDILLARYGKYLVYALFPLAIVGGAGTYFVLEMTQLSFGAGGTKYAPGIPAAPAIDAKKAHYCAPEYTSPWIACSGAIQ